MLRKVLRKFQPNFWRYVKKIEAQAKKWFSYKKKRAHYNKVTSFCHRIILLSNSHIFHKNASLNLETLLKDIFEKCRHKHTCIVKMNDLFYLSIVLYMITFSKLISHAF